MQAIRNYNLWTLIALYVAFTLFVSTTPSFHFVIKNVLERNLRKPWMTRRSTWKVSPGRN